MIVYLEKSSRKVDILKKWTIKNIILETYEISIHNTSFMNISLGSNKVKMFYYIFHLFFPSTCNASRKKLLMHTSINNISQKIYCKPYFIMLEIKLDFWQSIKSWFKGVSWVGYTSIHLNLDRIYLMLYEFYNFYVIHLFLYTESC